MQVGVPGLEKRGRECRLRPCRRVGWPRSLPPPSYSPHSLPDVTDVDLRAKKSLLRGGRAGRGTASLLFLEPIVLGASESLIAHAESLHICAFPSAPKFDARSNAFFHQSEALSNQTHGFGTWGSLALPVLCIKTPARDTMVPVTRPPGQERACAEKNNPGSLSLLQRPLCHK